jgi:hypothetical protein
MPRLARYRNGKASWGATLGSGLLPPDNAMMTHIAVGADLAGAIDLR